MSIDRSVRWQKENPEKYLIRSARHRAKKAGLPFNITVADILIPEICPVLGTKIEKGNNQQKDNSPSVDRIIPSLGYVRGNVRVISWRANNLKRDASVVELEAVLLDLKRTATELTALRDAIDSTICNRPRD